MATPAPVPQAPRRRRRRVELDALYACEYCPRTYGSRSARRVHVLLKHRDAPAPPTTTWRDLGFMDAQD
jgi:hypothetical protein